MLKSQTRKNNRAIFLSSITGFFVLACLVSHNLFPYIGINVLFNTVPSLPSTANSTHPFYGENVDMSQILPTSQHYVINSKGQDLIDIAADLGISLIRITNVQRSFDNNADAIYTGDQWRLVLSKMQSKGMKALIVIETASNNGDYYAHDIRPAYLHLVQQYIDSGVFSNPDVYAVDIKNEPLLTDDNLSMLQAAHTMIKAKYPKLKQTIGWWATPKSSQDSYNLDNYNWSDYSAGKKIASMVDFYSIHMYGLTPSNGMMNLNPSLKAKVFISEVQNGLQTTKPILIEEFGEANGDAVSDADTIGSPQLQANVYQGVYQALEEMHSSQVIGSVAFDFYSRNQKPDAWAIVKNQGNYLFPAAYILQEYALGKNNPSLQAATVVKSQSYLVTNSDNYNTKHLYIADRIGFKLKLDNNQKYSLSISPEGILRPIEVFQYDSVFDSYYAVYQVISKGKVLLQITLNANCMISDICTTPVYTLTINVQ